MKEQLLPYNTDPKRQPRAKDLLLPFSQRDGFGRTMPSMLTHRIDSAELDSLGCQLSREQRDHDRAKAARRYAQLTRKASVPA